MKSLSRKVAGAEASPTLALSALAKQLRSEGVDVVSLTAGEPDFPTPAHIKEAAKKAIDENFTMYTHNAGIPELRTAIVEKFRRDNGLTFDVNEILVSNGAKHSIFNALCAICNRGDEVIVPAPYWVSYPEIVKLVDAKPVILQAAEQKRFKVTPAQLRKAITKKTKALIICSPSNPTGSMYTGEDLREIAHLVRKHNLYVISDEIYEKVIYDGARHESIGAIEEIRDNVITVNGVSKAFSMTGWRIGYLGARRPIVEAAEKVQSQTTSNASSISQRAALAALNGGEEEVAAMREEFLKRRNFIHTALSSIPGVRCIKPDGAFYLFPNVSKFFGRTYRGTTLKSGDDVATYLLEEERVVVVPGSGFGAKKFIRLSYACSMHELEKAAERLKRGFELIR